MDAQGAEAEKRGILKVGDRVGSINTYHPCWKCHACKTLGAQLCENVGGMLGVSGGKDAPNGESVVCVCGSQTYPQQDLTPNYASFPLGPAGKDGGFADYMIADDTVLAKIPESISFEQAAPLFCAGATTYGALLATKAPKGAWVAQIGVGGLGHLGIQYSKALGYKVVAIDNRKEALEVAKSAPKHLQADEYVLIDSEDAEKKATEKLGNGFHDSNPGLDAVVINTEARNLIRFAQNCTRKGGIVVDVGLPADGPLEVDPFCLSFKEQIVRGRLICTPEQSADMVKLHAEHGCQTYIEKTYPLKDIAKAQERYLQKDLKGRLVIVMDN